MPMPSKGDAAVESRPKDRAAESGRFADDAVASSTYPNLIWLVGLSVWAVVTFRIMVLATPFDEEWIGTVWWGLGTQELMQI